MVEDRPFYGEFGWAYDALMARPAGGRCAFIADQRSVIGVEVGSRLLDAGCGTGDYALEVSGASRRSTPKNSSSTSSNVTSSTARERGGCLSTSS